jgi:hypothetical protein
MKINKIVILRNTKKKRIILACLLFFSSFSFCQKNEISILNDRFYFQFPKGAKNVPNDPDIMPQNPNENIETRIVYQQGDEKLAFIAQELYLKSIKDLAKELNDTYNSNNQNQYSLKNLVSEDSVSGILLSPTVFDSTEDAIPINYFVVRNPDNTLCQIIAYINPNAFSEKEKFKKISESVFSSFRKGERRLNLNQNTQVFNVINTKTKLQFKLPNNYVVTAYKNAAFEDYTIRKIISYEDSDVAILRLYFGFHPSYLSSEYGIEKDSVASSSEEFMYHKTDWANFYAPEKSLFIREQWFVDDEIQKDMQINIGMVSINQESINEMSEIVKNILIIYGK